MRTDEQRENRGKLSGPTEGKQLITCSSAMADFSRVPVCSRENPANFDRESAFQSENREEFA